MKGGIDLAAIHAMLLSPLLAQRIDCHIIHDFLTRFVQSVKGDTTVAASTSSSALAASAAAPPAIDPFKEFAQKEARQAENRLGTVERLTLDFARGFLSNPTGRRFLFFYFLILHVLTYMSILSHADHHQ